MKLDCSKKKVWELLSSGRSVEEMDLPDELFQQMKTWQDELQDAFDKLLDVLSNLLVVFQPESKKAIALETGIYDEYKPMLYALYDGNRERVKEMIWKKLKPKSA